MRNLPQFQNDDKDLQLLQNSWATALNPILQNPSLQCTILQNIALTTGSNTVNHKLGRKLQGWRIVRLRAKASIYDTQDSNPMPALTLTLVSDANVTCDLEVF